MIMILKYIKEAIMSQARAMAPAAAEPKTRHIRIEDACVASAELLSRNGKLWIEHGGEKYMLRRTANNRLILTK